MGLDTIINRLLIQIVKECLQFGVILNICDLQYSHGKKYVVKL